MPRTKQFDETEVLERAVELFWKQGYHATSMNDLVKYLGISRASLYDTFESKRALFDRALASYRNKNTCGLREFLLQQRSVKAGIQALFERAIDDSVADMDRKGCFVVNTTTELAAVDKKIQQMGIENRQYFELLFREYLQTGIDNGEISTDKNVVELSSFLFTFYNGIRVIAKIEPDRKKLLASIQPALRVLE